MTLEGDCYWKLFNDDGGAMTADVLHVCYLTCVSSILGLTTHLHIPKTLWQLAKRID